MLNLSIVHRTSGEDFNVSPELVWKTCLRQVCFASAPDKRPGDEVFVGLDAVQLLCEIICGLKSPVFGETEVQAQFKKFFQLLPASHLLKTNSIVSDIIFQTVKSVRQKYLTAAGQLSYGQILRHKLKTKRRIFLWGFGSLGQEISIWLKSADLRIIARNPEKLIKNLVQTIPTYESIPDSFLVEPTSNCHIIASDIEDQKVIELAFHHSTELIFDLRDKSDLRHSKITNLQMFLNEIESLKFEQKKALPICQKMIRQSIQNSLQASGATNVV